MAVSKRIRAVYAELRWALEDELPAGEIFRLACDVVELVDHRVLVDTTRGGGRPDSSSVDQMICRSGWTLVEEARRSGYFDDDEPPPPARWKQTIESMELAA